MQYFITFCLCIFLHLFQPLQAQEYKTLQRLNTPELEIFYSNNQKPVATTIAHRAHDAILYYQYLLQFKPQVTLLVLAPDDWKLYTKSPVYGMPHYSGSKILNVASSDNAFWNSFLPPLDQLPLPLHSQIVKTYRDSNRVSMRPFFDLLALHELGHAFHMQANLEMQRKWMGELFVNILLHTYIAEKDTASLAALTLFPRMVIGNGVKEYTYTSLQSLDEGYDDIARNHPKNYGWYQCRLHAGAAKIYERDGKLAAVKLWNALKHTTTRLDDKELLQLLETNGLTSIADLIRDWDRGTSQ